MDGLVARMVEIKMKPAFLLLKFNGKRHSGALNVAGRMKLRGF